MYFNVFSFKVKVINKEDDRLGPRSCIYKPQMIYPADQDLQGRLEDRIWPSVSCSGHVWTLIQAEVA